MSTMELMDHLKGITSEKTCYDPNNTEHTKNYVPFIISRFVSMCDLFLPFVNEVNKYLTVLRKEDHRTYFWALLPQRNFYFKYLKKPKENNVDDKEIIGKFFKFGTRDSEAALKLLSPDQIKNIRSKYKHGIE